MNRKLVLVLSIISILLGLTVSISSAVSYYDRMCSCPAEIVGTPPIPCCTDPSAILLISLGIILVVIGLTAFVKLMPNK